MRVPIPNFFPSLPPLEEPIRSELFGIDRLEQHAMSLAAAQRVTAGWEPRKALLPRVEENGRVLRAANQAVADALREDRWITPAAEWLVDNFFVVDEQLREIRDDLPVGFYKELPSLADGPLAGLPAGLRHRVGVCRAHGQPLRSRHAAPVRACLSESAAADNRRALGASRSRCAWCSSKICAASPTRSCADARARQEADALADEFLGLGRRRRADARRRSWPATTIRGSSPLSPSSSCSGCAIRIRR